MVANPDIVARRARRPGRGDQGAPGLLRRGDEAPISTTSTGEPEVNAIVALRARPADGQARAKDDALARGEAVGPLHGFPHAVKDLQPVKGMPLHPGLADLQGHRRHRPTAIMVERLRKAGVMFIGKTNTPGIRPGLAHLQSGLGRDPQSLRPDQVGGRHQRRGGGRRWPRACCRWPTAATIGGSLRNPAGWNNVVGFRTSQGRVPVHGREDWLPGMGVTGPMARSVADVALLLRSRPATTRARRCRWRATGASSWARWTGP